MEDLRIFEEAIENYIRPATFPVAIKLLGSEADIPQGVERASQFFGHKINVCQGWALARYNGKAVAMLKDDIACPVVIIALGLAEPPRFWLEGKLYLGWYTEDPAVAAKIASTIPRFPVGEYIGLVTAPVKSCDFEPDMVMVYCNPLQALRLIQAALSQEGDRFPCHLWTRGLCADVLVTAQQTGRCQFGIPCGGDRNYGYTSADEVVFVTPTTRLDEVATGLKLLAEHGHSLQTVRYLDFEPVQREQYRKLREMI
ncbi:DUF169 domain-containing protein [Chloroflexota bacterium]